MLISGKLTSEQGVLYFFCILFRFSFARLSLIPPRFVSANALGRLGVQIKDTIKAN